MRFPFCPTCTLVLQRGDLTASDSDAIVNAANPRMLGGGGVDGAIHRAAGPELLEACRDVAQVRSGVRCPPGEARITPGFALSALHVIHTVGPVYRSARESEPILTAAYRNSLALAREKGLRTIAFPAISCGVYGYPLEESASIALQTCRRHCRGFTEIRFVLFTEATWTSWSVEATRLWGDRGKDNS